MDKDEIFMQKFSEFFGVTFVDVTPSPKRIQRKRTKGWAMPENAVYVGRPTKWGNPFWHTAKFHGAEKALALYASLVRGAWNPSLVEDIPTAKSEYEAHLAWLKRIGGHPLEAIAELRGKDLACFCPLDQKCHADILLELANR